MADHSVTVAKMARLLSIAHIIVGVLLLGFGIADGVTTTSYHYSDFRSAAGYVYFGVWIGIWMCITGGLGIPGSSRERTFSRNCFGGVFMGFSITSAVMGGIIIICYSIVIAINRDGYYYDRYDYYDDSYRTRNIYMYNAKMAISAIILVLGIAEFVIGIWAAICCCVMNVCCAPQQAQQVAYTANSAGYVVTQGPDGVPVAVAMQPAGGMFAVQAPGVQEGQTPMVMVPVPGAAGGHPMIVQAASPGAEPATSHTYTPQQDEMSVGHGKYMRLNENA